MWLQLWIAIRLNRTSTLKYFQTFTNSQKLPKIRTKVCLKALSFAILIVAVEGTIELNCTLALSITSLVHFGSALNSRHLRATRAVTAFYTLLLLDQLAQSSIPDLLSSVLFSQNGLTKRSGCREQQKGVICRDAPHFSVWHASVCSTVLNSVNRMLGRVIPTWTELDF